MNTDPLPRDVTIDFSSWFRQMALKYTGREHLTMRQNAYFFFRKVYQMPASEAWRHATLHATGIWSQS